MTPAATAILGIPVDNLSMDEAISGILEMITAYHSDGRPRYVATINVDFITNILSWRLRRTRHPELMHILRRADMVTADGMPIVWASIWLGTPLKTRVAGSDMAPRLVEAAAIAGKSVYFLGGKRFEMTAYRAARVLKKKLPALEVVGVDAPWVHTAGESLAQAEEEDLKVVEKINAARPDILLIAFGSPKQEIWFDRNRHRLKVPVTIGVGATFEFLAGTMDRAPLWMQQSGLEWLFRLSQEPKRLWKRYLIDFLKFGILIWPSVFYRWYISIIGVSTEKAADQAPVIPPESGESSTVVPVLLPLPAHLDTAGAVNTAAAFQAASDIMIDFCKVTDVDAGGIGTLARAWQHAEASGTELNVAGLSPRHRRFLSINRLLDFFRSTRRPSFFYSGQSLANDMVLLRLSGVLDTRHVAGLEYQKLLQDIGLRDCIIDLTDLSYIGSSGLMLMLKISKHVLSNGKCFVICSPQTDVRQMFRMTDLKRLFVILADDRAAEHFIHEVRGEKVL
jgi:N-acetylglucosaminyldiphosphoundecaprenol N-acetyl-beta-D-mannosaminyltransferase